MSNVDNKYIHGFKISFKWWGWKQRPLEILNGIPTATITAFDGMGN